MFSGLRHCAFWGRSGFALGLLPALALLFNWPYLMGGFPADDIIFLNLLEQDPLPFSRWRGLWSIDDVPAFRHLWWKDPDFGGAFWRPLPSLVIEGSLGNMFARLMRCDPELVPGRRYEKAPFTAILAEMTEDGSDVLGVQFDLYRPLEHPGWLFLRWDGEAFVPLDIAALEIGETVQLADTSDVFAAMS